MTGERLAGRGDDVRGAGTRRGQGDPEPPGRPGVAVSGVAGSLLVPDAHQAHAAARETLPGSQVVYAG